MRTLRSTWMLVGLLAMVAIVQPARADQGDGGLRPAVLETFLRMRVLAAVFDTQAVEGAYPGPTTGLVQVASLDNRTLARARRFGGSTRDAWGNPLLYWSDGRDYLILSLGSDRTAQFNYDSVPPYADVRRGWAGTDPTDDLLIVDGVAYRGPATQAEELRRAMGEVRTIGTACESFAVDNNIYPGPVIPIDVIARIAAVIEPLYVRGLPQVDPWGNPYLFWSDTQNYGIVSFGPDGVPDYPYANWGRAEFEALHTGATTRFGQDLVFVGGSFVQWPAIVARP